MYSGAAMAENWKMNAVMVQLRSVPRAPQIPGKSFGLERVDMAETPDCSRSTMHMANRIRRNGVPSLISDCSNMNTIMEEQVKEIPPVILGMMAIPTCWAGVR